MTLIKSLLEKTGRLLAKTVRSLVKDKNFGNEGFLLLAAKTSVHGNEELSVEACKCFDAKFCELFERLKSLEIEIINEKESGPKRKKAKLSLDNIFSTVTKVPEKDPIKRGNQLVKAYLKKRDYSRTNSNSAVGMNAMTQTLFRLKHEKPYRLDELYDEKDGIIKGFIEQYGKLYFGKEAEFDRQLKQLLGSYSSNFSKIVSLKT